jgi:O-methyltransferase
VKKLLKTLVSAAGYEIKKKQSVQQEAGYEEFMEIYHQCGRYSMTGLEPMYALYKAVEYIARNNIKGDFIECGVWRGGSSMLIAKTLQKFESTHRSIYLFDTFEGMSAPTSDDISALNGTSARALLDATAGDKQSKIWCYASLDEVRNNMQSTGYHESKIFYVKGKVEDTMPSYSFSSPFALVRLDTDWYESTKVEMQVLYPQIVQGGILIIDDYGHWQGAKKAVDEYMGENKIPMLLNRIDYTVRLGVKV